MSGGIVPPGYDENDSVFDGFPFSNSDPTGLEQSKYDFTYRVFPENLGDEENSHYMIININVPTIFGINAGTVPDSDPISIYEFSKVDQLRFGASGSALTGDKTALQRGVRRIAESIALHMPNGGLIFTDDNKYEEVSMTAMAGSFIGTGLDILSRRADPTGTTGGILSKAVDAVTGLVSNVGKVTGFPINPMVEILFATRPQRQWMFEVLLAPRTQTEAETIREIIRTLRLYAAPELTAFGFAFIPPAEFDITFYRNGKENTYLPRINTCVLEKIDIDYAPADGKYSTFRDGSPVAVRLSLGFREVEIAHKKRIYQGF